MNRMIYMLAGLLICFLPAKAQWQLIDTIDKANYVNIHFHDINSGFISGEIDGKLLSTANGGSSWDTVQVPFLDKYTDHLSDMQFVTKNIGFICGGSGFSSIPNILMRTKDGGKTWDSTILTSLPVYEFNALDFKANGNDIEGIVLAYSYIFHVTDTGRTFTNIVKPTFNFYGVDAVYAGNSRVLLLGYDVAAKTYRIHSSDDWGLNWDLRYYDTMNITSLAIGGINGFATCEKGYILKTTDGGNTWTKVKIAADDVFFTRVKYGANGYPYLLATNATNSVGYVYGSDNNGKTWHSALVDNTTGLTDISMPATSTGYINTYRKIYKTTNGGGLGLHIDNLPGAAKNVKLYPNPTSGWLNIEADPTVEIKALALYDATGKYVAKWEGHRQRINVAGFAKGVYYMQVETNETVFTKKLVLE